MNSTVRNLLSTTCLTAFLVWAVTGSAHANPEGGVVSAGQANITANGKTLDIYQQSQKAVIDWRSFDINADETTAFHQQDSNSITLNRVHSNSASQINGNLTANGNVVIVNQNGVVFGAGSQVDVHGLVASTADIDNDHFMNDDKLYFNKAGQSNASIINNGSITAKEAGLVGFVAPNVENNGVITARMGRVHLASGSTATVDFYGDGLMEVQVGDDVQSQLVSNTGAINADGGVVALTAAAGGNIVHSLINSSGSIRAQAVGVKNGEIIISAAGRNAVAGNVAANKGKKQGSSKVVVSGSLDVSGKNAGETGGKVVVTADEVVLKSTASVDASGYLGGGTINLGGDYQGSGDTPNALYLTVEHGAIINNRSIYTGNGGRTILWSDGETIFEGDIIATGGSLSGDGGFTEVSGHDGLNYNGFADLRAVNGASGILLLDPTDITISNAASSSIGYSGGTYTGSAATSNLNVGVLQTQLASASVIVNTASSYTGNGDITVADAITWSSVNNLTLTANRDININAGVTINGSAVLTANAGRNLTYNANVTISNGSAGGIAGTAVNNLTVASGAVLTTGSAGYINLRAANGVVTNTGLLTLDGKINAGTGLLTLLSGVNGTARNSLTLDSAHFSMRGASVGTVSLTGFYDVNLNQVLNSTSSVTVGAYNDLNINAALTSGNNTAMNLTALHDMNFNANATAAGTGGITALATNNLTVVSAATLSSGATGVLSLRAANGVTTNTGLLTLNGKINAGTNTLTLLSGLDTSGTRSNLTLNSSTYSQGATVGTVSITGFNDVSVSNPLTSSSTITINALNDLNLNAALLGGTNMGLSLTATRDLLMNANVTAVGSGALTGLAGRNLTIASGVTASSGATGATSLRAANGSTTGIGLFALNGKLSVGSGALTLVSGLDTSGNRANITLNSATYSQAATIAGANLTGFYDINLNTAITSGTSLTFAALNDLNINAPLTAANNTNITLTAARDLLVNGNLSTAGTGGISALATRNLTIASGATLTAGAAGLMNLRSANGGTSNQGVLTLNGTINVGTGALTLLSGLNVTARSSLILDNATFLMQGSSVAAVNITGFYDVNFNKAFTSLAAITVTATNDISVNAAMVSGTNSAVALTATHDINLNANVTAAGSGGIAALATNNLTVAAGKVISSGATGLINLRAAGGVVTAAGVLSMNGTINAGSGTLTLLSGLSTSGTRSNLTLDSSNLLIQGSAVGATTLSGFNNITLNSALTSSGAIAVTAYNDFIVNAALTGGLNGAITTIASHDMLFNANVTASGTGNVSAIAANNLTVASGVTVASGATGGLSLRAANAVVTNTGLLTLNGKISNGTGTLGLVSGVSGTSRTNLTLDSSTFLMQGASISAINLSGFNDINLNTAMTATSTFSASAYHDLNFNSNITLSGASNITGLAVNNLTVASGATLTSGATGSIILRAANASISNQGILTLNGKLVTGLNGSGFTLLSGLNGTNRADLLLDANSYAQPNGGSAGVNITGFRDVTINTNLSATNAAINVVAQRNLTIGSGAIIQAGSVSSTILQAAGGVSTNTGVFTLNGKINAGNNALTLSSGRDTSGNSVDIVLDSSNFSQQAALIGSTSFTGFRDITLNTNLSSSWGLYFTALRNLTINPGITLSAAVELQLRAAGNNINSLGLMNLNGKIIAGTGNLFISSGVDSSGNRSNLTLDTNSYAQAANIGLVSIEGFGDVALNTNMTSNSTSGVTIRAQRNLTIASGSTLQALSNMFLYAAGGVTTNTGLLSLNGKLNTGYGTLSLFSGVNGSIRSDLTLDANNYTQPSGVNGITINGFRDVNINTDLVSSNGVGIYASRNLSLASGKKIQSGIGGAIILQAAGGNISNTGLLALNGLVNVGAGTLSLLSGVDTSGNRLDFVWDNAHITSQASTFGGVSIAGFRDVTLASSITSPSYIAVIAERNLTVNSGVTLQNGATSSLTLNAAGGNKNNVGVLTLNGLLNFGSNINSITGLSLVSGVDASGHRADINLSNSNLQFQYANVGNISVDGFRDITLNTSINSNGTIFANADHDLTIGTSGHISGDTNVTLVAGHNFVNLAGAGGLSSGAGRWLVYSTDPTQNVSGNLPYNFRAFSCSYGGACTIPTSGNGFIYKTFDYEGISASLPSAAIQLPQTTIVTHNPTTYAPTATSSEGGDGFMAVASTDQDLDNMSGLNSRAVLIIEPELAKKLDLKDWNF